MSVIEVEVELIYAKDKLKEQATQLATKELVIAELVKQHETQQQSIASLKAQIVDLEHTITTLQSFEPTYA